MKDKWFILAAALGAASMVLWARQQDLGRYVQMHGERFDEAILDTKTGRLFLLADGRAMTWNPTVDPHDTQKK